MAKSKAPSLLDVLPEISKGKLQPVYYLFGDDYFLLQNTIKALENAAAPFITSDFDKETFYGDDRTLNDALDFASAFPFGSEKKLIREREIHKVKYKNTPNQNAASLVKFPILILVHNG